MNESAPWLVAFTFPHYYLKACVSNRNLKSISFPFPFTFPYTTPSLKNLQRFDFDNWLFSPIASLFLCLLFQVLTFQPAISTPSTGSVSGTIFLSPVLCVEKDTKRMSVPFLPQCAISAAMETCTPTGCWRASLGRMSSECLLQSWVVLWVCVPQVLTIQYAPVCMKLWY